MNWKKYFDRIYCLHYVGHANRLPGLLGELKRVGICDSGIFEFRWTTDDPFERFIENANRRLATLSEQNRAYTSVLVNYSRILREARDLKMRRILVLEDDIRFLKDPAEIEELLEHMPDTGIVQFDKHLAGPFWDTTDYREWVKPHLRADGLYFDPDGQWFGSSACMAFTADGAAETLKVIESTYNCPDGAFRMCKSYAVAFRNLAVQVMYDNGAIRALFGRNTHHDTYARQGIDYADYNVPEGYGKMDGYSPDVKPAEHKLRIHVYAITKNEEKFVDRWVDSMKEADGIHVLDTGSTDGTVGKLKARGVHVETKVYRPWRFDVPRNDSMALCPADADILVCTDLDEVLQHGWREKLERQWSEALDAGKHPTVARYDYIWSFQPDGTPGRKFRYEKIHVPNLYEWRYPVHELLFRKDDKPTEYLETNGILLEHHPDPSKSRGQYLELLKLSVEEDPKNDRNTHYYARELTFRGKWDEAIEWHGKYLSMGGWSAERAASMMYMGRCYWEKGDREKADYWWMKGEAEDRNHREAAWEALCRFYSAKDWNNAIQHATALLRVKNMTDDYVTDREAWGWKPYDMLGIALWYAGRKDEAREVFAITVQKFPDNEHLKDNLARCFGTWGWIR